MYKRCQTEQSANRQRELEQGLLEAMCKKHYDQISVSDLCDDMGIPRKAFYRYFSGKDGALFALIDHALMDYDTYSTLENVRDHHANPKEYMERVFSYWVENKNLLDALERSNLSGVLIQRAIAYTKELDSLPDFFCSPNRQLRDYATMFAVCGLMTMLVQWHHDGFSESVEQMAELAIHLFSEPLFKPKG